MGVGNPTFNTTSGLHAFICHFLCDHCQITVFELLFLLSKVSMIMVATLRDCHEGAERRSESALQTVMCYTLITPTESLLLKVAQKKRYRKIKSQM